MNLPKIDNYCYDGNYGAHSLVLDFGPLRVWYSYKTPVAFCVDGHSRIVHWNDWGSTTGKHINAIDGGDKFAKAKRVNAEEFAIRWAEQVKPLLDKWQ